MPNVIGILLNVLGGIFYFQLNSSGAELSLQCLNNISNLTGLQRNTHTHTQDAILPVCPFCLTVFRPHDDGCSGRLPHILRCRIGGHFSQNAARLTDSFLRFTESIYRRGARRWRKLYYASGHAFQAKRFNRVRY